MERPSGVYKMSFMFWSVIQSLLGGIQTTLLPLEEDTQSFHMAPIA